jgi:hypothetical protein
MQHSASDMPNDVPAPNMPNEASTLVVSGMQGFFLEHVQLPKVRASAEPVQH